MIQIFLFFKIISFRSNFDYLMFLIDLIIMNFYSFIDFDVSLNLGIYSKSGFQTILKFEQSLAVF